MKEDTEEVSVDALIDLLGGCTILHWVLGIGAMTRDEQEVELPAK
jgi:hypothetical protein